MGLLEKHKVKMTPTPPSPRSHLGWRRWDACATNHLYSLISANDPRCCLLLSEQMTLRTNWEGRMKRWAAGMRKEEWSARDGMGWGGGAICLRTGVEIEREIAHAICQVLQKEAFIAHIDVFVCVFCSKMKHLGCSLNHLGHCLHCLLSSLKEQPPPPNPHPPATTTRKLEMRCTYCLSVFGHLRRSQM